MGLCFSYQQRKDLECLSSFFTIQPYLFGVDCPEDLSNEPINAPLVEAPPSPTTMQGELIQDPPCCPATPPSPIPTTTAEILAREERRRKRDERRAARCISNNLNIINNSISVVDEKYALKSLSELLDDRCKLGIQTYHPYDAKKKCLVLDIDYTIFDHKSDFDFALEFKRPYLHEFLKTCDAHYNIIIWSATAFYHIQTKMEKLQLFNHPDFHICSVLSRDHMIPYSFSIKRKTYIHDIKPLPLLWQKFPEYFNPGNTIHIDDVEENFVLNQRNGLRIDPFREALLFRHTDRELFYLAQYLTIIAELPSFEPLDHYKWKDYVINTLWSLQTVISLPTFTPPAPPSPELLHQHQLSLDLKRALKEKAREGDLDRNALRLEELRIPEENNRVVGEIRIENGDGRESQEWNARLEQELDNLAKAAMADAERTSTRKHKSTSPNRTPQQRPTLSPILSQQQNQHGQLFTPPSQTMTLSPQMSPIGQFNPQKLTLSNLTTNSPKLTLSPKLTTNPPSPQLTLTRPPSPYLPLHQPLTLPLTSDSAHQSSHSIQQQHEAHKRSKGRDKDGLRQRRSKEEGKDVSKERVEGGRGEGREGGDGFGERKADWVVTDVQLLDLIRHPATTDIILPLHSGAECARG